MKKKHLLAGKKRKESRFVSVSHFRYLHYYRVNISTTTTLLQKSPMYTSRGKCYKIVETGREKQRQQTTVEVVAKGKLLLACLLLCSQMLFFFSLQNASVFFSRSTTSKRDRIFCLNFFFTSELLLSRGEIGRGQFQKATYFNCKS